MFKRFIALFGWRQVGHTCKRTTTRRYGFTFERMRTGDWFELWLGLHWWAFTRYTANRHTGPEANDAVKAAFYTGPDRRVKSQDFSAGFAAAAAKPIPSLRNRDFGDECPGCSDPEC